nr:hypothetical protein [Streptomyces sabulosicollis]
MAALWSTSGRQGHFRVSEEVSFGGVTAAKAGIQEPSSSSPAMAG